MLSFILLNLYNYTYTVLLIIFYEKINKFNELNLMYKQKETNFINLFMATLFKCWMKLQLLSYLLLVSIDKRKRIFKYFFNI